MSKNKLHTVYSRCFGGRKDLYLQECYNGTRQQCIKWIDTVSRQGKPTHFYFISSLDLEAATKRYL